jgi:hypothetical protein
MDDREQYASGIRRVILQGLNKWRANEPIDPSTHPKWLQSLLKKQSECGWRNFFEGLFIREWSVVMTKQLRMIGSTKSPKRWVTALILMLWQIAWDLWEHRNGYLYDKEDSLLIRQLNEAIEYQFALGTTSLEPHTKALFRPGLGAILRKPMDIKQQWVRRVELAREVESTKDHDFYRTERSVMAQWLGSKR